MTLHLYTGLLWVLAILRWLLYFGRWTFALFVIVMSIAHPDGFTDLAITVLVLVASWWCLGQMVLGIDEFGGRLWLAILKIREPESFEALAALNDDDSLQLNQELLYESRGGPIGEKLRKFNLRELPEAEIEAMRERFRDAGF
jgi:hypothetical protein